MAYKPSGRGFTLIELIMVIVIIGVLSAAGLSMLMPFMQNGVFIPQQMNADMVVTDALEIMIEGDNQARGLRFSRALTTIQDYQIIFINHDSQTVLYRLDTAVNKLYRSINGGAESVIPGYVAASDLSLFGKSSRLFTFYDANEVVTAVPNNVRWITMTMIGRTGSGLYSDWQGQSEQSSAIAVNRFQ